MKSAKEIEGIEICDICEFKTVNVQEMPCMRCGAALNYDLFIETVRDNLVCED
jgi:hypothetical protein